MGQKIKLSHLATLLQAPHSDAAVAALGILRQDWARTRKICGDNGVLALLFATLHDHPQLFGMLPEAVQMQTRIQTLKSRRKSHHLKVQIAQIAEKMAQVDPGLKILLIKGAVDLYRPLYPDPAYRVMVDLDLYFEDPKIMRVLAALGYETFIPETGKIADFDADFVAQNKTRHHHMPFLVCPDHRVGIEMHHSAVKNQFLPDLPKTAHDFHTPLPEHPNVFLPGPMDQFHIAFIHCVYVDRFSHKINYRLRNLIEAYLLFGKLTAQEQDRVVQHFTQTGRIRDLKFWQLLCFKLFNAPEFNTPYAPGLHLRYLGFRLFNHSHRYRAVLYAINFVYRVAWRDLWRPGGLSHLWKKLQNSERRQMFLTKLRATIGL